MTRPRREPLIVPVFGLSGMVQGLDAEFLRLGRGARPA